MRLRQVFAVLLLVTSSLRATAHAQEHIELTTPDPSGDLGLTVLGGLGGAVLAAGVIAGAYYWTVSCQRHSPGDDCVVPRIAYALLPAVMATPVLISTGVVLAANATGGRGYFLATALGLLGFAPGIAVLVLAQDLQIPAVNRFGVGLMAAGYLTGAIIGYRWSAPDAPRSSVTIAPTPDGAAFVLTTSF